MDRADRTRKMGILNEVDYEKAQDEVKLAQLRFESAKQESSLAGETLSFEVRNRESQVEQQRLVVAELERQVAALAVKAPFAGLVSRVAVADRDSVTEGQPLVGVVDLSRLEVEVWVPRATRPTSSRRHRRCSPSTAAVQGEVTSLSPEVQGSRVLGIVGSAARRRPAQAEPARRRQAGAGDARNVLKLQRGPSSRRSRAQAYVVETASPTAADRGGSVSITEIEIAGGLREGDQIVLSIPRRSRVPREFVAALS